MHVCVCVLCLCVCVCVLCVCVCVCVCMCVCVCVCMCVLFNVYGMVTYAVLSFSLFSVDLFCGSDGEGSS